MSDMQFRDEMFRLTHQTTGEKYYKKGLYKKAIESYLKDLEFYRKFIPTYEPIRDDRDSAFVHVKLGEAYIQTGEYDNAIHHLNIARDVYWDDEEEPHDKEIIKIYELMELIHSSIEDLESSAAYRRIINDLISGEI